MGRIYGCPDEWPSRPEQGHFRIIEGEWLNADASDAHNGSQDNNAHEIFVIIVPVEDVKVVEFMELGVYDDTTE